MTKPFISVCIPVYNAAPYLEACVESILSQSFQDFELILVDDGSSDASPALCDALSEKYRRIRTVHIANSGATPARGAGAALANGEWVLFIDADDTIPADALETLAEGTKEDTDIVVGFHFETGWPAYFHDIDSWRRKMIVGDILLCSPVARLFRRSILSDECFSLIHAKGAGTDMIMNEKIAFATEKPVYILNKKVYEYNIHPDSLSHSARWTSAMIMQRYEDIFDSVPAEKLEEMMPALIENRLNAIKSVSLSQRRRELSSTGYIRRLKNDIKENGFPLSFSQRLSAYCPDSFITTLTHRLNFRLKTGREFLHRIINEKFRKRSCS